VGRPRLHPVVSVQAGLRATAAALPWRKGNHKGCPRNPFENLHLEKADVDGILAP
jgi:hypothetical protein